jgi:dTDP-4-amino-4,6-dideoxygalactose transaminase
MEGIQGAVLRVKLRHLENWTEARRAHAARYSDLLMNTPIEAPKTTTDRRHVFHIYAIRTATRAALQRDLHGKEIQTGIHYPIPVHLQPAYAELGYRQGNFPCSEGAAEEVLSLPMFAELTKEQLEDVTSAVRESTNV